MAIVRLEPATEALISLGDFVALLNGNNPSFLASRRIAPCSRPDRPLPAGASRRAAHFCRPRDRRLGRRLSLRRALDGRPPCDHHATDFRRRFWATIFGARNSALPSEPLLARSSAWLSVSSFGFPGIIFGPFIGAVVGELSAQKFEAGNPRRCRRDHRPRARCRDQVGVGVNDDRRFSYSSLFIVNREC